MTISTAEWDVRLDPTEVATNRAELDLQSGVIRVSDAGVDWGDAVISAFLADQKYGSDKLDYRVPNRIVTIPLGLGMGDYTQAAFDAARVQLHQKVGLLQRDGGWLKRARSGVKMYADIVNATLHEPDVWGPTGGVEDGVVLTLELLPDFYGDEVTLDAISGSGPLRGVLKQGGVNAVIAGDYPARCRLVVSDTSGNQQKGLLWGLRSRHYDSASTAALFYEAESMTGLNGAASFVHAGASGGSTMRITAIPAQSSGLWVPMLLTDVSTAQLTHQGSYRVWARVYATDGGSQVRLVWGSGSLASPTANDAQSVPGTGAFYLVDLGTIRIDASPVTGTASWQGVVQVQDPNGSGTFEVDYLMLQPIDESSGRESAIATIPQVIVAPNNQGFANSDWTSLSLAAGATSASTSWKDLGFSIPAAATILGVRVALPRSASRSASIVDITAKLLQAGVAVGSNKALGVTWPVAQADAIYGGPTDLWGAAWTPTDIGNVQFGVQLVVKNAGPQTAVANTAGLVVTVYYKLSTGFTVAQDVVIDANGSCEIRTEGEYRPDPAAGTWGDISNVIGDLPRIPPSGMENRLVELLTDTSRGDLGTDPVTSQDAALDGVSVVTKYRPCYLQRP